MIPMIKWRWVKGDDFKIDDWKGNEWITYSAWRASAMSEPDPPVKKNSYQARECFILTPAQVSFSNLKYLSVSEYFSESDAEWYWKMLHLNDN